MAQPYITIAAVQMTSAATVKENVTQAEHMIQDALPADLICFPECANLIQQDVDKAVKEVFFEEEDPFLACLRDLCKTHGVWIHTGSLAVKLPGGKRLANRTLIIDPKGEIRARYDKIHLFDANPDGRTPYRESDLFRPGDQAVILATPWGTWGLAICYDIRFPHLFRAYAKAGASVMFLPAAFTVPSGRAHWQPLLRARAIENGSFVVATAQCGLHPDGRQTFGHSTVVSPWGEILAEAGETPGVLRARLDLRQVPEVRQHLPSLRNERPFKPPIQ